MTKWSQTREQVRDLIGQLDLGDAIPSERQLSVTFGVSRMTVRAALDELTREGYLTRRRGAGTFVSDPRIALGLTLSSFTDDMQHRGMTASSRTLDLRVVYAGATLGRVLHVSPSEPVVVIKRLRFADRKALAIETLHVRQSLVPGLTGNDLEKHSFYTLLRDRYGLAIAGGRETIEPTVTSEEESDALGVPLHSPAFLLERLTHSETGAIIEFVRSIYRGDRYRLVTELTGVPARVAKTGSESSAYVLERRCC
jgi:GntR family transcriptional regulator